MQWQPFTAKGVLSASSANLLYPGTIASGVGWQDGGATNVQAVSCLVTYIRIMNNDTSTRTVSFAIGTTAVAPSATNSMFFPLTYSLTAKTPYDWTGEVMLMGTNTGHFLVGLADSANVVTYKIQGYVGIA